MHENVTDSQEFSDPALFKGDLEWIADRAKLLTWTLDEMAAAHFSLKNDNEWLWKLSMVFVRVISSDLERAAHFANAVSEAPQLREAAE
jgi:hypothetical protein